MNIDLTKKSYVVPSMDVVNMDNGLILCGSGDSDGSQENSESMSEKDYFDGFQ